MSEFKYRMLSPKFCVVYPWLYVVRGFVADQLVKFNLLLEESHIKVFCLPMSFAPSHTEEIDLETY